MKITFVFGSLLVIFYDSVNADESCITPTGEIGKCVHIDNCEIFKTVERITSIEEFFLRLSIRICRKPSQNIICCGSMFGFKTTTSTTTISEVELEDICGIPGGFERIIGGNLTGIDEFPWMALLQYRNTKTNTLNYQCGGSLINNRYVLTAAHCLVTVPNIELTMVRLGDWNYTSPIDCDDDNVCNEPIDVEIDEIISHENYSLKDPNKHNDIGLIRLKTTVQFNDFIKPICLPKNSEKVGLEENLIVTGWGIYDVVTRESSDVLKKANIKISRSCKRQYKKQDITLSKHQICAGGEENVDSCGGDSGGPLMRSINAKYYVYGLVSFGPENCGSAGQASIYTNVFSFIDWIMKQMKP